MVALSQHDLLRLLESLRSADGLELVRSVAERMLQELIEAEATARIGAEWNEHTDTRTALRNGHRDKTLTTQAGDLDLAIPKLRSGSFFPALLERRRRIDQALYAARTGRAVGAVAEPTGDAGAIDFLGCGDRGRRGGVQRHDRTSWCSGRLRHRCCYQEVLLVRTASPIPLRRPADQFMDRH
jgi:hypothetical protein